MGSLVRRRQNKGNKACAGHHGTTTTPFALSFMIFRRTRGIKINGGKAKNLIPDQENVNASTPIEFGSGNHDT